MIKSSPSGYPQSAVWHDKDAKLENESCYKHLLDTLDSFDSFRKGKKTEYSAVSVRATTWPSATQWQSAKCRSQKSGIWNNLLILVAWNYFWKCHEMELEPCWWGHLSRCLTVTCSSAAIHSAKCTNWSLIQVTSRTEMRWTQVKQQSQIDRRSNLRTSSANQCEKVAIWSILPNYMLAS